MSEFIIRKADKIKFIKTKAAKAIYKKSDSCYLLKFGNGLFLSYAS